MSLYYILDGHELRPAETMEWAMWFQLAGEDRIVAKTQLPDDVLVSTVFLGLDHGFGNGPPLVFETMVFGKGDRDEICERYSTWAEAEVGHMEIVERLTNARRER